MSNYESYNLDLNDDEMKKAGQDTWADMMNEFEEWDRKQAKARAKPAAPPATPTPAPPAPAAAESAQPPAATPAAPAPAPPAPAAPPPAARPNRPLSRYEELCRTPSMKMEADDLAVITRFSEIISKVNEVASIVEKLRTDSPTYAPERFACLWQSNMKEAAQVMMREFHEMRHGRMQKKYDAKYICKACNSVFLIPLPGGVCDECRAAKTPRQKPAE